jgi:hypothetical protein
MAQKGADRMTLPIGDVEEELRRNDLAHLTSDWRQFDLMVAGQPCSARVLARVKSRDLVEYIVIDGHGLMRTGLRWMKHGTGHHPGDLRVSRGRDVDYRRFSDGMLAELARVQVHWVGRPTGCEVPVPRPKLQLDDRLCLRLVTRTGAAPISASQESTRPFVLSGRGAATVLTAWMGEPVRVRWRGKPQPVWIGLLAPVGAPESLRVGLRVQAVEFAREGDPAVGQHVEFDADQVSSIYNRTRDSVLANLSDMWDFRPTLGSTCRKVAFSKDVNIPLKQEDIDDLVTGYYAGERIQVSTEEVIERYLAGGFWGDCELGASAYWLLHPNDEDEDRYEQTDDDQPLFIYEMRHSKGERVFIAVRTSSWDSFDGGPSWRDYDEQVYGSLDEIEKAYGVDAEIEML